MSAPTAPSHALEIGPLRVWPPVVLAPMAGVTNPPFRQLCRRYGAGLYVSEMVTARGLVEGGARTDHLARFAPDEDPRSIQLYGTDARIMGEAVRRLVGEDRVDHVDLNFGCPAKKITRHGGGAAVPARPRLFESIVRAAVEAAGDVPVTVKFRMGLSAEILTYLDAGRLAEEAGAVAVALHARTAEQLYSGRADWDAVARLKQHVTTIPVLGNGDIWEASDALALVAATGCDGVVVGRGCLGRPWLFRDLLDAFEGRSVAPAPTLGDALDVMLDHAQLQEQWFGPDGIRDFRKHTSWYSKGYPIGGPARHALAQTSSFAELATLVSTLDRSLVLPPGAVRHPRGHTGGPRKVTLPHGWLDDLDADVVVPAAAEATVSGG